MTYGIERRIYEIERRLRDLDLKSRNEEDRSDAERQWWTIPLRSRTLPPAPPPPPPGHIVHCCTGPIPGLLRCREYFNGALAFEYTLVWNTTSATGFPASNGFVWTGARPIGSVVTHVYCTNYFGGPNYYWNIEQGGAYVGANTSLSTCSPFHLEFEIPTTTLRFVVDAI